MADGTAHRCDAFNARVEQYLCASGRGHRAAASAFWAAFEDFRACYYTYAPEFIPPPTDDMTRPLASYYLYRRKLHALLEAGSEVCAEAVAEARATWAAHEIWYEQYLHAEGRDSAAWLQTFQADLQDATRACMLQIVEQYPDTRQLAAACASGSDGVVCVADEIWAALPLAQMADADILLIEHEVVGLCGQRPRGAVEAAMAAVQGAATQANAGVPTPPTSESCEAVQGRGLLQAVPRAPIAATRAAPVPSVAIRPTMASTCASSSGVPARRDSGGGTARVSQGRARSRSKRPRPRRPRHRSVSRGRRRRSRSPLPRAPHRTAEARGALMLRPRAWSPYNRSH
jgi:hypothetical protein